VLTSFPINIAPSPTRATAGLVLASAAPTTPAVIEVIEANPETVR
jgi:hypothetical protein